MKRNLTKPTTNLQLFAPPIYNTNNVLFARRSYAPRSYPSSLLHRRSPPFKAPFHLPPHSPRPPRNHLLSLSHLTPYNKRNAPSRHLRLPPLTYPHPPSAHLPPNHHLRLYPRSSPRALTPQPYPHLHCPPYLQPLHPQPRTRKHAQHAPVIRLLGR